MILSRGRAWTAIAALSLLFHLKGISSPPSDYHYHRQTNTATIARNFHRDGLNFFKPQIDWEGPYRGKAATEFPLYMWLVGLLWPLAGLGALWGRVLSSLFSAATAVYLYEFLLRELKPDEALIGALVFCVLPLEVYFGRTIQPEALALLCTVAALFHWDRALGKDRPWADWALAVACAFLAIAHKLPYAYLLLVLAAQAFLRLGKSTWTDWRVWLAPVAAVAGVVAWYVFASSGLYVVPTHEGEFLELFHYVKLPYYVEYQFLSRFPELSATYGGLLFLFFGAVELKRRGGKALFAWWFAAISLYIVVCGAYSFHHEYTSLPFEPVVAAVIGVGIPALWRRSRGWGRKGVVLAVLAMPALGTYRIHHWYRTSYAFLDGARAVANQISGPDDLFICNERASSLFLYFLDRRGWSWGLAETGPASLPLVEKDIADGAKFFMTHKAEDFATPAASPYAEYFYSRFPVVYDRDGILIFGLSPKESKAARR